MPFFYQSIMLLSLFLGLNSSLWAWNEDYTAPTPRNKEACIKNLNALWKGSTVEVRYVSLEEACSSDEIRYQWIYGNIPKGSIALVPKKTLDNIFPPSIASWPSSENSGSPRIWHFSCLAATQRDLLGASIKSYAFKGEITAPAKYQSCEAAYSMAQSVCINQLGGHELYEQCSGGSSSTLSAP